jgi:hypothetical protein
MKIKKQKWNSCKLKARNSKAHQLTFMEFNQSGIVDRYIVYRGKNIYPLEEHLCLEEFHPNAIDHYYLIR